MKSCRTSRRYTTTCCGKAIHCAFPVRSTGLSGARKLRQNKSLCGDFHCLVCHTARWTRMLIRCVWSSVKACLLQRSTLLHHRTISSQSAIEPSRLRQRSVTPRRALGDPASPTTMARMLTTVQMSLETLLKLHRPLLQTRLVLDMAENGGVVAFSGPAKATTY